MKPSKWMLASLKSVWPSALAATFLSAIAAGLGLYIIGRIGAIVASGAFRDDFVNCSFLLLVLMLLTLVARSVLSRMVQDLTYKVRKDLLLRIISCTVSRFEEISASRIYAALTVDVQNIAGILGNIPMLIFNGLLLLFGLSYIFALSGKVFLIIIGVALLNIVISVLIQRSAIDTLSKFRKIQGDLFLAYEALAYGKKEFMLSQARRNRFLNVELENLLNGYRRAMVRADMHWELVGAWGEAAIMFLLLVLATLASKYASVDNIVIAKVAMIIFYLRSPVASVIDSAQRWTSAGVTFRNLEQLQLDQDKYVMNAVAVHGRAINEIVLRNIEFAYHSENGDPQFAIGPLDMHLQAGKVTFITGGNGSGKSSLCKVIAGLYDAEVGEIYVDQQKITSSGQLREHAIVLFSDYFAFDTLPLEENELDAQQLQRIEDWLSQFRLADKTALNGNRWTYTKLSTGQRRRLAMISTLCEDKSVIIFDEPTADQDPEMRHHFYHQVVPYLRTLGKIVIIISHDESYFHCADRLYALQDGKVIKCEDAPPTVKLVAAEMPAPAAAEIENGADNNAANKGGGKMLAGLLATLAANLLLACVLFGGALSASPAYATGKDVDGERAKATLAEILGPEQKPHPTGSRENLEVGHRIFQKLTQYGLQPAWQKETHCVQRSCASVANIIATHTPQPGAKAILLLAHYDSVAAGPGAADNGLGVATLLEFARAVARYPQQNFILLFSDGEELGLIGAHVFANRHPLAQQIEFVINMDSIGSGGPLVVFDFGFAPEYAAKVLRHTQTAAVQSSFFDGVAKLSPHLTDLSVFSNKNIPGLAMGYVAEGLHYHLPGDRLENIKASQFQEMGETLHSLVKHYPQARSEQTTGKLNLLTVLPGVNLALPASVLLGAGLLLALLMGWKLLKMPPQDRLEAVQGMAWLIFATVISMVLAFLLQTALEGNHAPQHWHQYLLPLLPLMSFAAILGVAARVKQLEDGLALLLTVASLLSLVRYPWLGGILLLCATPLVVIRSLWPQKNLLAVCCAAAGTLILCGFWLYLGDRIVSPVIAPLSAALWSLLWLMLTPALIQLRERGRRVGLALLLCALGAQAAALSWYPPQTLKRIRLDLVERLDQQTSFLIAGSNEESVQAQLPDSFSSHLLPVFPWDQKSGQHMQVLSVPQHPSALESGKMKGNQLHLRFAQNSDVLSYSLFIPQMAGLKKVMLNKQEHLIAPEGGIKINGYQVFILRDGLRLQPEITLEFSEVKAAGAIYLLAERAAGADLRPYLQSMKIAHETDYFSDRYLTIENAIKN